MCGLAVAADTATFTSACSKIGFIPVGNSTCFLSRVLGTRRAMDLFMTNRILTASDARLPSEMATSHDGQEGSHSPPFLEPRKTGGRALVAVIQEGWIGGLSTRWGPPWRHAPFPPHRQPRPTRGLMRR